MRLPKLLCLSVLRVLRRGERGLDEGWGRTWLQSGEHSQSGIHIQEDLQRILGHAEVVSGVGVNGKHGFKGRSEWEDYFVYLLILLWRLSEISNQHIREEVIL